jgi:enoyl-CoA hydratase
MEVLFEKKGKVCTIIMNRPEVKNAVNARTSKLLADAFRTFEKDSELSAAVLWGAGGCFCAGADLKEIAVAKKVAEKRLSGVMNDNGPMGPTRMRLSKPVIAAVAGHAVAGGLELACWCDLRVVERDAVFGVFCRRFGVPLIDGGTQRLPRLIGLSRAMDMILTGRPVGAEEALAIGLANRVVEKGRSREEAEALAATLAAFPQCCMRSDREAVYRGLDLDKALGLEFKLGMRVIKSGETTEGAGRFHGGAGRHGAF